MSNNTIIYNMGKLGKFLAGREEGENAYYVLKRDVFDKIKDDEKVSFTFDGVAIFNPSYGDETLGRLEEEFPNKIIIDNNIKNAFRKALETIEITRGVKFRYI